MSDAKTLRTVTDFDGVVYCSWVKPYAVDPLADSWDFTDDELKRCDAEESGEGRCIAPTCKRSGYLGIDRRATQKEQTDE